MILERDTRDRTLRVHPPRERRAGEKETTRRTDVFVLVTGARAVAAASALEHLCLSHETHTRDWTHLERERREREKETTRRTGVFVYGRTRGRGRVRTRAPLSLSLSGDTHTRLDPPREIEGDARKR